MNLTNLLVTLFILAVIGASLPTIPAPLQKSTHLLSPASTGDLSSLQSTRGFDEINEGTDIAVVVIGSIFGFGLIVVGIVAIAKCYAQVRTLHKWPQI
jgi:hypothetical protein